MPQTEEKDKKTGISKLLLRFEGQSLDYFSIVGVGTRMEQDVHSATGLKHVLVLKLMFPPYETTFSYATAELCEAKKALLEQEMAKCGTKFSDEL